MLNNRVILQQSHWLPTTAAAAADSAVISATPIVVTKILAVNSTVTDVWLQLFDSATVPADTTYPRVPAVLVPGTGEPVAVDFGGGLLCSNGLAWAASSTVATKTITALSCLQVSAEVAP